MHPSPRAPAQRRAVRLAVIALLVLPRLAVAQGPAPVGLTPPPVVERVRATDLRQPVAREEDSGGSWKTGVILGLVTGVIGGIALAGYEDEGEPSTGDRIKAGILGGLIIAVPFTVIFVLLTGN